MHDHDLNLVAAYADGSASSADAAVVADWLDTCSVCTEELAAQRLAIEAIMSAEPVAMTDVERARLHRGVREAIAREELLGGPVAKPTKSASNRWVRVLAGSAAAVVALVLAGGVLLPLVGGGSEGAGSEGADTAASQALTTSAAAADTETGAAAESADDASMAAAPPADGFGYTTVQDLGEVTFETLGAMAVDVDEAAAGSFITRDTITREEPADVSRDELNDLEVGPTLGCLEEGTALLDGGIVRLQAVANLDGELIEIFQSDADLFALRTRDCAVIFPVDD